MESVTIGYVFKAQILLPENASNYLNPLNDPFDITTEPFTRRRRRSIEGLEGPIETIQTTQIPENVPIHGFDYEQNERYERYEGKVDVIESGMETTFDDSDENIDDGLWIDQKDSLNSDPGAWKISQYQGSTRFSLYKGISAVIERFELCKKNQ